MGFWQISLFVLVINFPGNYFEISSSRGRSDKPGKYPETRDSMEINEILRVDFNCSNKLSR